MTDLQRLITLAEAAANGAWDDHPMRCDPNWQMHAETARILSLLLRVREGCDIQEIESWEGDQQMLMIVGRFEPLRDLAELLGGGK